MPIFLPTLISKEAGVNELQMESAVYKSFLNRQVNKLYFTLSKETSGQSSFSKLKSFDRDS